MPKTAIWAGLLLASPLPASPQPAAAGAERTGWSHIYTCSIVTDAASPAAEGKAKGAAGRIDLRFDVGAPSGQGAVPTITASARADGEDFRFNIAHKRSDTGTQRLSAQVDDLATFGCTGRALAADDLVRKTDAAAMASGWACAVSGSARAPRFTVTILLPPPDAPTPTNWSFGASNSGAVSGPVGSGRISIVPRETAGAADSTIACASEGRRAVQYDLAFNKTV